MKKFWNWIHDDSGGRVLRLEGPIDSESFWGDEITPQMMNYMRRRVTLPYGLTRRVETCSLRRRSIPCSVIIPEK